MHNLIPNVQKTMEQSFIAYIENSIKNNWDLDALTDYKGATLQYNCTQGRQDCRLWKKQLSLGSYFPCHTNVWSRYCTYSP